MTGFASLNLLQSLSVPRLEAQDVRLRSLRGHTTQNAVGLCNAACSDWLFVSSVYTKLSADKATRVRPTTDETTSSSPAKGDRALSLARTDDRLVKLRLVLNTSSSRERRPLTAQFSLNVSTSRLMYAAILKAVSATTTFPLVLNLLRCSPSSPISLKNCRFPWLLRKRLTPSTPAP